MTKNHGFLPCYFSDIHHFPMSITLESRINAFSRLGEVMNRMANLLADAGSDSDGEPTDLDIIQRQTSNKNPWFTRDSIAFSLKELSRLLTKEKLNEWLQSYPVLATGNDSNKRVAIINAGNIPLVGFHDFMSVLLAGHRYLAKNATDDPFLLPFIAAQLISIEPAFKDLIEFNERLSNFDAVIATGSNNSSRYFEYYFSKYPHIIRKNRNAVAILDGTESEGTLRNLGDDIFLYFGLGCRSVSKLYVPRGYSFNKFFETIFDRSEVMQHNKYMNNFEHHNAVYLLKRIPFLQNGFLILKEDQAIASPIAVIHYEYYDSDGQLQKSLSDSVQSLQCIVCTEGKVGEESILKKLRVDFGQSQHPALADYADGVDTMKFLSSL